MKNKLVLNNLTATHLNSDGTNDLQFEFDGKMVFLKNAEVHSDAAPDSLEFEFYWDDAANVQRAVDEADDNDIEVK